MINTPPPPPPLPPSLKVSSPKHVSKKARKDCHVQCKLVLSLRKWNCERKERKGKDAGQKVIGFRSSADVLAFHADVLRASSRVPSPARFNRRSLGGLRDESKERRASVASHADVLGGSSRVSSPARFNRRSLGGLRDESKERRASVASHADVLGGSSGTRDEPLRTTTWEATAWASTEVYPGETFPSPERNPPF